MLVIPTRTTGGGARSRRFPGYNMSSSTLALTWLLSSLPHALATPLYPRQSNNDNSNSGGNSLGAVSTWVPVAIVIMIVVILVVLSWTKLGARLRMRISGAVSVTATPAAPVITTTTTTTTTAGTAATPRRNRRRASQISTRSLPAYKEEPGDEELVLVRRTLAMDAMNDHSQLFSDSTSVEAPTPSGASTPEHDRPTPTTSNSAPAELQFSLSQNEGMLTPEHTRPSFDTSHTADIGSDESAMSLMHNHRHGDDATPSYFEVVSPQEAQRISMDLNRIPSASTLSISSPPTIQLPEPAATPDNSTGSGTGPSSSRRRSAFLNIFQSRSSPSSSSQHPPPTTRSRHLSHGASSSTASLLSPTRSTSPPLLSPFHQGGQLTSPSVTSLSSLIISAPLPHTLTRTEFTYPKSGPSSQQIAFISSTDNLVRFGLPFGEEARAHQVPPPPFAEEGTSPPSPRPSMESSSSRRSPSHPERIEEETPSSTTSPIQDLPAVSVSRHVSSASTSSYATALDPGSNLASPRIVEEHNDSTPSPTRPPTPPPAPTPTPSEHLLPPRLSVTPASPLSPIPTLSTSSPITPRPEIVA